EDKPRRPLPFGLPLALFVALSVVALAAVLRLLAIWWFPSLASFVWPVLDGADGVMMLVGQEPFWPLPEQAAGMHLAGLWAVETAAEFVLALLLTRYGNLLYWALDRFFLEPFLIWPTEWMLAKLTAVYTVLLRISIRFWWVILGQGAALIAVALGFLYFDV